MPLEPMYAAKEHVYRAYDFVCPTHGMLKRLYIRSLSICAISGFRLLALQHINMIHPLKEQLQALPGETQLSDDPQPEEVRKQLEGINELFDRVCKGSDKTQQTIDLWEIEPTLIQRFKLFGMLHHK